MDFLNLIQQLDWPLRIGLSGLALSTLVWLFAMLIVGVTRPKVSGFRRAEIAVCVFSILIAVSLTLVGRAMTTKPEPDPSERETPAHSGGGTGTCASVRTGMSMQEVRTLLGTPSIDQNSEDTRGPGAHVMAFDDSRCIVHFIHEKVDQLE